MWETYFWRCSYKNRFINRVQNQSRPEINWYVVNILFLFSKHRTPQELKLLWSNLIFRFVPTVVTTQKCEPFVRENCSMIMKTVCNEVCKEECEVKDKKVCMTIPHQECRETSQQLCKDIPRSECKKVNYRKYCIDNHIDWKVEHYYK